MRDTDLYRRLLGLASPWTVDRVDLDVKTRQVDVYAKHEKPKFRRGGFDLYPLALSSHPGAG